MCNRSSYGPHHRRQQVRAWKRKQHAAMWGYPPVNVKEQDKEYTFQLFVPGYEKSDFHVTLTNNTLVVSVEDKNGDKIDEYLWERHEFKPRAFVRRFKLNEKMDKDSVMAKYNEGVLLIRISKLPGYETVRKEIKVN